MEMSVVKTVYVTSNSPVPKMVHAHVHVHINVCSKLAFMSIWRSRPTLPTLIPVTALNMYTCIINLATHVGDYPLYMYTVHTHVHVHVSLNLSQLL